MVFRTLFHLSVLVVAVCIYFLLSIPYYIFDLIRWVCIDVLNDAEERVDFPADADLRVRRLRIWLTPKYQEDRLREQAMKKRQKEIVDTRNLSQSRLYRLPTELLCLIDDHLDPAGVLAIRATCSTFRDRLGLARVEGQANTPEGAVARAQMSRWMIRQLYPRLCERERRVGAKANRHAPPLFLYLCQPCASRHPLASFSPEQIRAGPETRRCLRQERVFRMCEHMTVDFGAVKDSIKRPEYSENGIDAMWLNMPGRIACVDCPKRGGAPGLGNMDRDQAVLYERPRFGSKWYYRTRAIYPYEDMKKPNIRALFADLAYDDTPICPHVEIRHLDFMGYKSRNVYLDRTSEGFWGMCYICPAQFSLLWRKDPVRLVLIIHYQLGVRDCGPTWIAISKPPKSE